MSWSRLCASCAHPPVKGRLAYNAKAIGHKRVYATTVQTASWSPDNSSFYGDVETNLLTSDNVIVRADLTCHGS